MENPIVNRVARSSLVTVDLKDFTLQENAFITYSIRQYLESGLLREKSFRIALRSTDWQAYKNQYILIPTEQEMIIPQWAYMLLVSYLSPHAQLLVVGCKEDLQKQVFLENLKAINLDDYKDKAVIIKGCFQESYTEFMYAESTKYFLPVVRSLMYGEACSAVPIYKKNIGKKKR